MSIEDERYNDSIFRNAANPVIREIKIELGGNSKSTRVSLAKMNVGVPNTNAGKYRK